MSKIITKKQKEKKEQKLAIENEIVTHRNMGELCKEDMLIFGANNNLMRHIPSFYDGLKPGERRILYTMYHNLKLSHKSKYEKVATIVGNTLRYHPHGEAPVTNTLVKMAQPWETMMPLVEGYGNFGSSAGDPAAAGRYIEARLSYFAYKAYFEEFDPDTIDMVPNHTNDVFEPEYFPARYPVTLINGAFGIGYGLACGIPPHNFTEVIEATIQLLDSPSSDVFLVPDIPSGCYIVDNGELKDICMTGNGKLVMRGRIDLDETNNILAIRSTPWMVSLNKVLGDILELQEQKKITGIKDIDNQGEKGEIDLRLILKKEVDPIAIMHTIFSKTNMQTTKSVSFKVIDDFQDVDYNVKQFLLDWIDVRVETKRRQLNHQLIKAKERQHILSILVFILNKDNAEKTLKLVKNAENKKEIISGLMKLYGITSLQAETIANMRVTGFSKEAKKKYDSEKKEIDKKIESLEKLTRSAKKIKKIIKKELEEGIELFGTPRRSEVININGEVKIRNTRHVIVFTMNGFVKKLPETSDTIGYIEPGDYPIDIIIRGNVDELLVFDQTGKISKIPVHLIQNHTLESKGEPLSKLATINGQISRIIPKPTDEMIKMFEQKKLDVYILMITRNGIIKKTAVSNYMGIKNELLGMVIKDGDQLQCVKLLMGDKDIVVYSSKGLGIRFNSSELKETSRLTVGVKAMDLGKDETIIGMDLVNEGDNYLFALTTKGTGKKCTLSTFDTMERNAKPLRIITLDKGEELLTVRTVKGNETFKAYLKGSVETINLENVPELARLAKGKKLIPVRKGEQIIDIK